jgi:probable HAF family extracellular repeat protein
MKRQVLSAAALAAALIVPQQSVTATKPVSNITDLGTLGGQFSDAFGINNVNSDPASVQIVGRSTTAAGFLRAFVWTAPGPMIDLGTLGGNYGVAMEINNHGEVAGQSDDASEQRWAVVWTNTGSDWVIENLGTLSGACCASANGINNGSAGDPATVAVAGNAEGHAVVWKKAATGWTIQDLGTLPGDMFSTAFDINDVGDVVGLSQNSGATVTSAFLWNAAAGTMLELSSLGGDETYALRINNTSDVAGLSRDVSGNRHAVRWRSATNWTIEDLGTLGGCCSESYGINNFGDVVGVSSFSQRRNGFQHAFLFLASAAAMTDLGGLRGDSWARDVNDFGFAVGGGSTGRSVHALLWRLP